MHTLRRHHAPPSRGELYRRKTIFWTIFQFFFPSRLDLDPPTHFQFFLDFWNFLTLQSPLMFGQLHRYYYRRRRPMQISLHDWTKISLFVRNSTPIIASICIRLDIASPQHLDRLLFAFVLCFLRNFFLMSPRPPRARHAHRAHRYACGKIHAGL